jgi:LPS-assembly protein
MTLRTRFLITATFLCHQLLACLLVTSQLLSQTSGEKLWVPAQSAVTAGTATANAPCSGRAVAQLNDGTILCAITQEKDGDIYKLHGEIEIHYRDYVLRADEASYNSDTGEATASGHFRLDGGPNDDHIQASHGTYNLTTETGRFYDVTGTTGLRFNGRTAVLTSTAPFAFSGKLVEKTDSDHYFVYGGTITTCELPHPKWQFRAHEISVDVGGNASIYRSSFSLFGLPFLYFPYVTHPVARQTRHSGFLLPMVGQDSIRGTTIGDAFYWAINRSMDLNLGAEYFSKRGWSQRVEYRARPSDTSYVDLSFFGVIDRGIETGTAIGPQLLREGGQEVRLQAQSNFYGFRAVSNVDYLSKFIFRLAFNDVFTQAVNSEVKSQAFLSKDIDGFSLSGMVERYQNFFQETVNGTLTNPPVFTDVQIWHSPSLDASSADRPLWHTPFNWSFDASFAGLSRSEPGFSTAKILGRFDLNPEISLPWQFHGWSLRPALALHETYYTQRFVNGQALYDPTNREALDASVEIRPPVLEKVFGRELLGQRWKHVIEPGIVYRYVTGVNDFANVLHFDERDILSNTHEVGYGIVTRLFAKRLSPQPEECETPMTGLAIGSAAPEQIVPWERSPELDNGPCPASPPVREVATWELAQKYFLDPTFGGALISGQRNVFTTTEELTGIAFLTQPRHLSPLVSRLRVATSSRTHTEWYTDYDFQLGRMNASTLLLNYDAGPFTIGGGDAFLQIPQTSQNSATSLPNEGKCTTATSTSTQVTCKFQQFRVALGYGGAAHRGFSAATTFGIDSEIRQLQFATAQTTYNWDCCGMTLEYRRYAIANVRNENLFRFTFTLANIGSLGNLRRQERLY